VIDERLADELILRTLCWRPAPDRYLTSSRGWISRSKFRPLANVRDALRLVDAVTRDYSLVATTGRPFMAQIRVAGRTGTAAGEPKARTICLALAEALGIEAEANC
jgi:hypothetical protein